MQLVVIAARDYTLVDQDYDFLSALGEAWDIERVVLRAPNEGDAEAQIYAWADSEIGNTYIVHPDQIRYGSRDNQMQENDLISTLHGDEGDVVLAFGSDRVTSIICLNARHRGVRTLTMTCGRDG